MGCGRLQLTHPDDDETSRGKAAVRHIEVRKGLNLLDAGAFSIYGEADLYSKSSRI